MNTSVTTFANPVSGPYFIQFPWVLDNHCSVTIHGKVLKDSNPRKFQIGFTEEGDLHNVIYNFSPCFDDNVVVRDTCHYGVYGERETEGDMPFVLGQEFEITFIVLEGHFKAIVNGNMHSEYLHRMPMKRGKFLFFQGCMEVNSMQFCSDTRGDDVHRELSIPFVSPITVFVGRKIYISGVPSLASRFTIYLGATETTHRGGDVMLVFDARFQFGSHRHVVVQNSRTDHWQKEVRPCGFPFEVGKFTNILIEVTHEAYKVAVNDKDYCEFKHRLPIEKVKYLLIEGAISLRSVNF